MNGQEKSERRRPWRLLKAWELVLLAFIFLLMQIMVIPNFMRVGGSGRDAVPLTFTCVLAGLVVLCFVLCPWHHRIAKAALAITLACSLAVSVTSYSMSRSFHSPVNECIANLRQINGAKQVWAQEEHKTKDDVPTAADLYGMNGYIRREPKCPKGGGYTIGRVGELSRCSVPEHSID